MTSAATTPQTPPTNRWRGPVVRIVVVIVLVASALLVIGGLVGDIDWSSVGESLGHLSWWQVAVLVVGLLVRQVLNALPLSIYIKGVGPFKAFVNDQTAILMTTVAPPPTDIVMRVAMFASWGVAPSAGLAGTAMNTVTFYVVRFGTPLLAILLMAFTGAWHFAELWTALLSILVSAALLILLWLMVRRAEAAATIGRRAAGLVARVRPTVEPESWAAKVTEFRSHVVHGIGRNLPRALLTLLVMVVVDALLIVVSLRFVGLTPSEAAAVPVLTAFLVAYPLTLFPFQGLGILDAVVVATLVHEFGHAVEADVVAGFIIWRTVTIVTPLVLGSICVLGWRFSTRTDPPPTA